MKTRKAIVLIAALCALVAPSLVRAQMPASLPTQSTFTPGIINYQGRLMTPEGPVYTNGVPVGGYYSNGIYEIEFRIYDAPVGGSNLWAARYSVYVKDGYFNVALGAPGGTSLGGAAYGELWKALWFDPSKAETANHRYLGLKVTSGVPGGLPEAFPRQRFLSAPFAERAQMAMYARESFDSFTVGSSLTVSTNATVNGTLTVKGSTTLTNATINGIAALNNGVTVNGSRGVFTKGLTVDGDCARMSNGIDVVGAASLNGGATVNGDLTVTNGTLRAPLLGAVTVSGDLTVTNGNLHAIASDFTQVAGYTNTLSIDTSTKESTICTYRPTANGFLFGRLRLKTGGYLQISINGTQVLSMIAYVSSSPGNVMNETPFCYPVREGDTIVIKHIATGTFFSGTDYASYAECSAWFRRLGQ